MVAGSWKEGLQGFFTERADVLGDQPSLADLCWASGREARIWSDPIRYAALVASIMELLNVDSDCDVLEVGSGSGFIATGIAPRLKAFTGVDLSVGAIKLASRLRLANAQFRCADGEKLPFPDGSFDGAFCYDVFTNLPTLADGAPIIAEMIRVVRAGGRVLLGSIPDCAVKYDFERAVQMLSEELNRRHGPPYAPVVRANGLLDRLRHKFFNAQSAQSTHGLSCYYFDRDDFVRLGEQLEVRCRIAPVHCENPYAAFRFNVIYEKVVA